MGKLCILRVLRQCVHCLIFSCSTLFNTPSCKQSCPDDRSRAASPEAALTQGKCRALCQM